MGSMYSLDWSWGWWNRFYSIGGFECIACCGGEEEEKEEEEKGGEGGGKDCLENPTGFAIKVH